MTDASKLAKIFLHEFGSGPHNTAHIENAKRDYAIGICKVLNALPELLAELGEAKAELERERMRLAACGIVAICNTRESAAQARDMHPDYRSASCDDVARSVDREMTLRKSLATLTRQRDGLKKALESQAAEWRNELVRLKLCNELGGPREASVKSKLQECEAALAAARKGRGMA